MRIISSVRILLVSRHFWPSLGGAEVMLERLATAWAAAGHSVTVVTSRSASLPKFDTSLGFPILRLAGPQVRWLGTAWYLARLFQVLRRTSADVVYVSMLKHSAFAALKAQRHGVPVVLRAEGAGATGDVDWQQHAPLGSWIRRTCRRATAIVGPSPAIIEELAGAGYAPDRLHWIPNGVPIPEEPWHPDQPCAYRRRLGLPERFTVCYTGRLHAGKGLTDLVDAAAALSRRGAVVQLLLLGEGPERTSLLERARKGGIGELVHLPGRVAAVEPYLRAGDLFVLPSYQEGLSVALLEAMALGMPAVASDIPANRCLDAAGALRFVPVRDAAALAAEVLRLQQNPAQAWAAGAAARRLVQRHYSLDTIAARHVELFAELLQRQDR